MRDRFHYLLIPAAALIAVIPLILYGPSCGHDFDFHLLNWLEAARQFSHGNLHPTWSYTTAYNAGEPRFVFYPPLSWTLGAFLGLILPWTWTPIAYTWLILTAAGLTLRRLARTFTTPVAATLAAIFYLANPYMLFTAYERTAYAELLAAVWIPLLLQAILQEQVTIPRIAIPVALLWLTNAPAAVMSCYALALLTLFRLILNERERLRIALTTTAGTLLGLALAAFYILPAAYQRRYVQIQMAILPGLRVQDNTLFHRLAATIIDPAALPDALAHDSVLHTASIVATLLIILAVIAFIAARKVGCPMIGERSEPIVGSLTPTDAPTTSVHPVLPSLTILTITIAILLTPISLPIWRHAPELAFLQFPWRLTAILAATLSLTIALALTRLRLDKTLIATIALATAATLTIPAYATFHQPCDDEDSVQGRVALFHSTSGTEPTDEYTPTTADNDALAKTNPPYWLSPNPNAPAPTNSQPGPAPTHLTLNPTSPQTLILNPTSPQTLILNLRDYPSWDITTNAPNNQHRNHPARIHREDGLIAIPIPAANITIDITRHRSPDQTYGYLITVLAFLALIAVILRNHTRTAPGM